MTRTIQLITTRLLAVAMLSASGPAAAAELNIRITGFKNEQGRARIVLMAGQTEWRGDAPPTRTASVSIKNGQAVWRATGLAPRAYAAIAHHDQDANEALDRPFLNLPLEPYGYSGGAWTSFGLPGWREVAFDLNDRPATQTIALRRNFFTWIGEALLLGLAPLLALLGLLRLLRSDRRQA